MSGGGNMYGIIIVGKWRKVRSHNSRPAAHSVHFPGDIRCFGGCLGDQVKRQGQCQWWEGINWASVLG